MRGVGADVAESLHDHASGRPVDAELSASLIAHDHHAAPGGFAASARSANIDRLASNNSRDGLAHVHGVGVHHPGHDLFVGVDVRRGNVFFGADELNQFGGVAARHALQFAHRHFVRIADHSALRAAEGNVDYGALPRHPAGQGADFIQRDIGRVTNAALRRTASDGVLHAESGEDFEMTVVHGNRDVHDDFAVGILQDLPESFVEVQLLGGQVKAS